MPKVRRLIRTRGSHRQFKHPVKPGRVTVPGKPGDDLPPGTWDSIMKYTVVIERTSNNYAAYVPDLPGCVATAGTRKEVLKEIREAIEFHIEGMREDGEPVPEPHTTAAVVDAAVTAVG